MREVAFNRLNLILSVTLAVVRSDLTDHINNRSVNDG
jgi:hypothetical protein